MQKGGSRWICSAAIKDLCDFLGHKGLGGTALLLPISINVVLDNSPWLLKNNNKKIKTKTELGEREVYVRPQICSPEHGRTVTLQWVEQVKKWDTTENEAGKNSSYCISASLSALTESLTSSNCSPEHCGVHWQQCDHVRLRLLHRQVRTWIMDLQWNGNTPWDPRPASCKLSTTRTLRIEDLAKELGSRAGEFISAQQLHWGVHLWAGSSWPLWAVPGTGTRQPDSVISAAVSTLLLG